MDCFAEQLVLRENTTADKTRNTMILISGILATIILFVVGLMSLGTIISFASFILALGAGYGTYFFIQSTTVEYEYTFTNGELDVDKIVARKKRTPMISVEVKSFEAFGKYSDSIPDSNDLTTILSSDNIASHEYYADFNHEKYGRTRLIFAPDERILNYIKKSLPYNLRK